MPVTDEAAALAGTCAYLADERKAERIVVLEVGRLAFFTDYFVIGTGHNERQIRAIAGRIQEQMTALGRTVIGVEGEPQSGWVLLDLGDVVVHLFSPEARALYDLELLWGAAPRLDWQQAYPAPAAAEGKMQTPQ